jgi:hypothetical protein
MSPRRFASLPKISGGRTVDREWLGVTGKVMTLTLDARTFEIRSFGISNHRRDLNALGSVHQISAQLTSR